MADLNINSTIPPPPPDAQNIVFVIDENENLSASDPIMVGDAGQGGLAGNVPAPSAGDAAAGKFLKADGTWTATGGILGYKVTNFLVVPQGAYSSLLSISGLPAGNYIVQMYYRTLNPCTFDCTLTFDDGHGPQTMFLAAGFVPMGTFRTAPVFVAVNDGSSATIVANPSVASNVYVSLSITTEG